jgi:hypothetical protein
MITDDINNSGDDTLQQRVENLSQQVGDLMQWRQERMRQQITSPLDFESIRAIGKYFLQFVDTFDTLSISGIEFPYAFITSVNDIKYFLQALPNFSIYSVNPATDLFFVSANPFVNGDAVTLYTNQVAPTPLVIGSVSYFISNVSGNQFNLSSTLNVVFTVSGITTAPTGGSIYSDGRQTYTVTSTSLSGSPKSGTITCSASGKPYQYPSGIISKVSGTGDANITYSLFVANGGSSIDVTSSGSGTQYMGYTQ